MPFIHSQTGFTATLLAVLGCAVASGSDSPPSSFTHPHSSSRPHNASACSECHSVPNLGGSSKVKVNAPVGHRQPSDSHVTLNLLGDGYVEAISDEELKLIAASQRRQTHGEIHGQATVVTIPERGTDRGVGRFGWKAQHATLLSASADALNRELGIPNSLFPSSSGVRLADKQALHQEENDAAELNAMVAFVRSTKPIQPDPERRNTESAIEGSKIFDAIGCSICHVKTLHTAPAGSELNRDMRAIPRDLGAREFHPFSDFLLHDVGTGDGLVQNIRPADYDVSTAGKFRTAPLWGVRFRSWLMHDGQSITYHQAILRHAGEASRVVQQYQALTPIEKEQLHRFLDSL